MAGVSIFRPGRRWVARPRALPGLVSGIGLAVALAMPSFASEPLKVPKPVPVRAGEMLADSFKAEAGDRVFFAEGSVGLGARARVALEAQAQWLKRHIGVRLIIEGHADDPGSPDGNETLSRARAEAVRERLITLGVDGERLAVAAHGRSQRAMVCSEPACAGHNRRVVTRIATYPTTPVGLEEPAHVQAPGVRPALRRLF